MTTAIATQPDHDRPPASRGAYRLEITCAIEFLGPLHVGTGERLSVVSDAPILRDAAGKPYLPQASVRGVLRDWCEREAPLLGIEQRYVWRLFGRTPTADEAEQTEKRRRRGADVDPHRYGDRQGRLTVSDVSLQGGRSEVRDHVRIDRRWGAAAHGGKFDQEIVYSTGATIQLVYEGDSAADPEIVLLQDAVEALEAGLLAFGGKTGWGFGWAIAARKAEYRHLERSNAALLAGYLKARLVGAGSTAQATQISAAPQPARAPQADEPCAWCWLRLDLELQFDGPMLVAGPDREEPQQNQRTPDAVYLRQINGKVVLPGSSWRGVLHSHADRIATTTLGCKTIADTLFGVVKDSDNTGFQGIVRVGEGKPIDLQGNELTADQVKTIWMDHVAIDRITGFAADQKLFNCRALASPRFTVPMLIRWHADDENMYAALALLLFSLRDAEEGLLWVGSRTTRGYGYLKDVTLKAGRLCIINPGGKRAPMDIAANTRIGALASVENIGPQIQELIQAWNRAGKEERA